MIIDGKEIKLVLDLVTYDDLCKHGYWVEEIDERLNGATQVQTVCDLISIMGTHGTEGEPIKAEWVKEHLSFAEYPKAKAELVAVIVKAMHSETAVEQNENTVVDEVLQEIEKKSDPTG